MNKYKCEVWLAVDKNGTECIYGAEPVRNKLAGEWLWNKNDTSFMTVPKGTIEKILGRKITWRNNAVKVE